MSKRKQVNQVNDLKQVDDFEDMGLKDTLLRGIFEYKFETPSPIQQKAIIPVIRGKDIIAQSQSGTGKTGAFLIGILQRIDERMSGCQAIVVSPTWELARQSVYVCKALSQFMDITVISCIGGTNIYDSKRLLQRGGASIVIGTPGRIVDMIRNRRFLSTANVRALILDEADELLKQNFQEQIKDIVTSTHAKTQICLFSATMPTPVIQITKKFMDDPIEILVKAEKLTLEGIKQYYVDVCKNAWKLDTLCDLYERKSFNQTIIYVNSKRSAQWLSKQLTERNFTVSTIYGGMDRDDRMSVMKDFRAGDSRVLISTDLLARGIDISKVATVINYDLPQDMETYLHRIGRSGRYGTRGVAISFITRGEKYALRDLEKFYKTSIDPLPAPESIKF